MSAPTTRSPSTDEPRLLLSGGEATALAPPWCESAVVRLLRSEVARWLLVSVAVLCLGVGGMVRTPGTAHSTWGEVAGFGSTMGSGECYLTVSYSVDGTAFRLRTPQQERWCDYSLASRPRGFVGTVPLPVLVYYDAADPGSATLTPRGAVPGATALVGLSGIAVVGLHLLRRRRRSDLPRSAPDPAEHAAPEH